MGVSTKPQDDAKAMTEEYVKGATIADLALKYNHSEQEVMDVVSKDADAEPAPVLQADQPEAEAPTEETLKQEVKKAK